MFDGNWSVDELPAQTLAPVWVGIKWESGECAEG